MNPKSIETVSDLAVYWLIVYAKERKAASSIQRDHGMLRTHILKKFGNRPISEISASEVETWLTELVSGGLSKKSANNILALFSKIFNDAARWDLLVKNHVAKIKKFKFAEKKLTYWTQREVKIFLGRFLNASDPPRICLPVVVALYTGLRRGEIQALQWRDIDERAGLICVQRSYCRVSKKVKAETKSKKIRYVPISISFASLLAKLKKSVKPDDLVVPFFSPECFRQEFNRFCIEARLPKIRFHDLRHTFASNFLMGGGNLYDLQQMLGHSTIQVTERYVHFMPSSLKGKTEVLGF